MFIGTAETNRTGAPGLAVKHSQFAPHASLRSARDPVLAPGAGILLASCDNNHIY